MPRKQKLKVFCTPAGFHDAYVAAPSQKAALKAWGSDNDLFARGLAERVDDPALMREPLEQPGVVIRRPRGTTNEQIAALQKNKPVTKRSTAKHRPAPAKLQPRPPRPPRKRAAPPKPKPDRGTLAEAERMLSEAKKRHAKERKELARRLAELERQRRGLERSQSTEIAKLGRKVEALETRYARAMRKWEQGRSART